MFVLKTGLRWAGWWGIGLVVLLAACNNLGKNEDVPDIMPTRTLIPNTATPTIIPDVNNIPTPTDLPAPAMLLPGAPPVSDLMIPPVVQLFIERIVDDLVEHHDVAPADIRLLSLEKFTWRDAAWGCAAQDDTRDNELIVTPGYRIAFSTKRQVYVYHTDNDATFFLCDDRAWLAQTGEPIIIDPVARSMVELSARNAAQRFDIPEADIILTNLLTVNWPNASVGCPQPGGDYEDTLTPGYRIVFLVAGDPVIYHTSIRHVVYCEPAAEILPGSLRRAVATPVPETDADG